MQGGVREKTLDPRDFSLGRIINLPPLEELPEYFEYPILGIKNQKSSDFCAAYAGVLLSELQEDVELSPEYLFAKAKEIEGDYTTWGLQLRDVMKTLQKKGTIKQADAPYTIEDSDRDFLANWQNWPDELDEKAKEHRKQSYFDVTGPYDHFDNARAAIWHFRGGRQGIECGVQFGWPLSTVVLDSVPASGYGHALAVTGFDRKNGEPVLIVRNSCGDTAGDNGTHYITRDVYNTFVERYGHYMMVDIDPELAKYKLDSGIKISDSWIVGLWKTLLALIKSLWKIYSKR